MVSSRNMRHADLNASSMEADEALRRQSELWLLLRLNLQSICNFPISRLGPLHFVTTWRRHCEPFQRLQPDQTSRNDLHAAPWRPPGQDRHKREHFSASHHSTHFPFQLSFPTRYTASTSASPLAPLRAIVIDYHSVSRLCLHGCCDVTPPHVIWLAFFLSLGQHQS